MKKEPTKRGLYDITHYRSPHGGELGPQMETQQRFCSNKTDAIKTGRIIARQANWRLVQIKDDNGKIIFE